MKNGQEMNEEVDEPVVANDQAQESDQSEEQIPVDTAEEPSDTEQPEEAVEAAPEEDAAPDPEPETPEDDSPSAPSSVHKLLNSLEAVGIARSSIQRMISLLLGIVLIALVVVGVGWYRMVQQTKSSEQFGKLLAAGTSESISTLVKEGLPASLDALALLKQGQLQYFEGNYSAAHATYGSFAAKHPGHAFGTTAELGVIVCTESMMKFDEALPQYEAFITAHTNDLMTSQAIFGRARCLEQLGRLEEARQVYEEFLVGRPDSVWIQRAEDSLESVDARIKRAERQL